MGRQLRFGIAPYEPMDTEYDRHNCPWWMDFIGFGHQGTRSNDVDAYRVEIHNSQIPNAGLGLFLVGEAAHDDMVVKMVKPEFMRREEFVISG